MLPTEIKVLTEIKVCQSQQVLRLPAPSRSRPIDRIRDRLFPMRLQHLLPRRNGLDFSRWRDVRDAPPLETDRRLEMNLVRSANTAFCARILTLSIKPGIPQSLCSTTLNWSRSPSEGRSILTGPNFSHAVGRRGCRT